MHTAVRSFLLFGALLGTLAFSPSANAQIGFGQSGQNQNVSSRRQWQAYEAGYRDGRRDLQRQQSPSPATNLWTSDAENRAYEVGYQDGYRGRTPRSQRDEGFGNGARNQYGQRRSRDRDVYGNGGYEYPQGGADSGGVFGNPSQNSNSQAYQAGYQDGTRDMQSHRPPRPKTNSWPEADRRDYDSGYRNGYTDAAAANNQQNGTGSVYGRERGRQDPSGLGQNAATDLARQAQQSGYTDGMYYAQRDLQTGNNNNPMNTKGYKDADNNYTSSLGSKAEYQRIYREAFVNGYQRGYRQQRRSGW